MSVSLSSPGRYVCFSPLAAPAQTSGYRYPQPYRAKRLECAALRRFALIGSPQFPIASLFAKARRNRALKTLRAAAGVLSCCALLLAVPFVATGQNTYVRQAYEYNITGPMPGDQVYPSVAFSASGGYLLWQDNRTDGDGLGISALRLDSSLSGSFSPFRVNQVGAGDQENAQVTMLIGGGAAFVWQGGRQSFQNIYARFLSSSNTWVSGDVTVNTFTNSGRLNPAIATLANGNVIVVWASINQVSSTSMQDVYGQLLSPTGQKIGGEFLINQFTDFNQRTPAVAALAGGGFVVVWVSEQQRSGNIDANAGSGMLVTYSSITNRPSVDIYARLFSATASPLGAEFLVNTGSTICANPRVAAASDGAFLIVWGQKDLQNPNNSWDIFARPFSSTAIGGTVSTVNTTLFGQQYLPQITALRTDYLVVWTSIGQDGSREGVFGQFLNADGSHNGGEFGVNTTTISQQMHPSVGSDGQDRLLVVWTSFTGVEGFDLFSQRYAAITQSLAPLAAPFVTVLSSNSLTISWPPLAGFNVASYEVYADGAATPTATPTNFWWKMSGLLPSSTHSFQVAYVLTDGRHSPLSAAASATTYGAGSTWGGIPQEWMSRYFGPDMFSWPSPFADSDGDGVSNFNEFLAGTDPTSANSVLKIRLQPTSQGLFLNWNTQVGLIYQVQTSTDLSTWTDVAGPRFAAGTLDSMYVGGSKANYYRVLRLR